MATSGEVGTAEKEALWGVKVMKQVMDVVTPLGNNDPHVQRLREALKLATAYYVYQLGDH